MFRTRIRGIYSTVLTKILLDHGFTIVRPSAVIRERFHLSDIDSDLPSDLEIYDRLDRQGVIAVGKTSAVAALISVLKPLLVDMVVRRRTPLRGTEYSLPIQDSSALKSVVKWAEKEVSTISRQEYVDLEFPAMSKSKLDAIRSAVTPTIDGHHYLRSCGGRIASLLEMAEKMLEKGAPRDEVERLLKESTRGQYPRLNSRIDIEHVKIDGRLFHLNNARIIDFDDEKGSLRLFRNIRSRGLYDGLRVPKEPGDYALTDLRIGDWIFRTSYFSSDGRYKGSYINLNTPIELYPDKIRYVDLEADVCLWPDGKVEKLDVDKLGEKISKGYISGRLGEIVKEKLEEVMDSIRQEE
ncbi:MAG: DUF402 domain-containing protein [Candidatus Bathyarchaeia archaeon]